MAIHTTYSDQALLQGGELANVLIPFLILMMPISDMIFVIFKRVINKKSPFLPDRNHFHHRLINAGFNHKNSVLFSYAISQLFLGIALAIHFQDYIFPILITCFIIFSTFILMKCDLIIKFPFKILIKSKIN